MGASSTEMISFELKAKGAADHGVQENGDAVNFGIAPGSLEDRAVGTLVGLAVGDALGTAVGFMSRGSFIPVTDMRGGGVFQLRPGE